MGVTVLGIQHNFYPRSPCGERQVTSKTPSLQVILFLSTLSLRRATCARFFQPFQRQISIHALLAESDILKLLPSSFSVTFLSTLSLRRATELASAPPGKILFLSTLSLRRATSYS